MKTFTHNDLSRAKRFGMCTNTPVAVYFDDWKVDSGGTGFELFREPHHTDSDIERAEKWLHAEHDVAAMCVATPAPLNLPTHKEAVRHE